jgi:hypothetical protein
MSARFTWPSLMWTERTLLRVSVTAATDVLLSATNSAT